MSATSAASFKKFRDVGFVSDPNIDSDSGVLFFELRIFANLAIKWERHAHFMTARAQLVRQRVHHLDQCSSALQRWPFRADHQDSHSKKRTAERSTINSERSAQADFKRISEFF